MDDTIVYELSAKSEGDPCVFIKKDWISILDNQNQNYQGNQCVIDTSQLSNSNKYMNYREAYLTVPLMINLTSSTSTGSFSPATAATSADYAIGLKNWYGSIIHSFTLDLAGTTVIQQTPYLGLWNNFKLLTTLSYNDILTQGAVIGFYPDNAKGFAFNSTASLNGIGASNNNNALTAPIVSGAFNSYDNSNSGFLLRQQAWNFDLAGLTAPNSDAYSTLTDSAKLSQLWKSYIFKKQNSTGTAAGIWQVAITGIIYLKHIHTFFEKIPLIKGIFMKLTLNLNQSSVNFGCDSSGNFTLPTVNSPLGGVSPILIASKTGSSGGSECFIADNNYIASVNVGKTCINSIQTTLGAAGSPFGGSIILNVPAYTFNPVIEQSYLQNPIKKIVFSDLYQYQITGTINESSVFNNLITNGIQNLKSVLVIPFFQSSANGGIAPFLSPFDTAGGGTTSPLCLLTNFNCQISGQNAIYNTEKYSYEQFCNQLKGVNAVNGGQTDGLTSGLIGLTEFENQYCYYYVDVHRMLPVEQDVPKALNIIGQNTSLKAIDLFVFAEYECACSVNIILGSRV